MEYGQKHDEQKGNLFWNKQVDWRVRKLREIMSRQG